MTKAATPRRTAVQNRLVAVSHPLRAEVLRILVERPASPVEIAHELGVPTPNVSHHAKRLVELDCAELAEERKVRGAIQHFYRATEIAFVSQDEWGQMEPREAMGFLAGIMQTILADYLASEKAELIGSDADFHLTRTPISIDQEGLEEGLKIFENARLAMMEVERRSAERSRGQGTQTFTTSSSLGLFKTPQPGKGSISV